MARRQVGDLDGAVAAARESATIAEQARDEEAHAYALAHAAYFDLLRDARAEASDEIVAALDVASRGGGRWATAIALLYAAEVAYAYERTRTRPSCSELHTRRSTRSARIAGTASGSTGSRRWRR